MGVLRSSGAGPVVDQIGVFVDASTRGGVRSEPNGAIDRIPSVGCHFASSEYLSGAAAAGWVRVSAAKTDGRTGSQESKGSLLFSLVFIKTLNQLNASRQSLQSREVIDSGAYLLEITFQMDSNLHYYTSL